MDNEGQTIPAESSPAPETAVVETDSKPMDLWSDEEHATWLEKGEVPKAGGSAPQKPADGKSTENTDADSGAAKETKQESQQQPRRGKNNAETRKAELAAEVQELLEARRAMREELAQLQAQRNGARPDSPPARQEPAAGGSPRPQRPKIEQFEDFDKYEAALDKYEEDLADWKVGQRIDKERAQAERAHQARTVHETNEKIKDSWAKRTKEATDRHEDFAEVVKGANLPLNPIMDSFILDSEIGPEIVYHLATNLEEAERIAQLGPHATARELTRIEDRLSAAIKGNGASQPKTITAAKPPGTQLGGTNKGPADEVEAALAANDPGRYIEEMNRRDAARLRGK